MKQLASMINLYICHILNMLKLYSPFSDPSYYVGRISEIDSSVKPLTNMVLSAHLFHFSLLGNWDLNLIQH